MAISNNKLIFDNLVTKLTMHFFILAVLIFLCVVFYQILTNENKKRKKLLLKNKKGKNEAKNTTNEDESSDEDDSDLSENSDEEESNFLLGKITSKEKNNKSEVYLSKNTLDKFFSFKNLSGEKNNDKDNKKDSLNYDNNFVRQLKLELENLEIYSNIELNKNEKIDYKNDKDLNIKCEINNDKNDLNNHYFSIKQISLINNLLTKINTTTNRSMFSDYNNKEIIINGDVSDIYSKNIGCF